MANKVTFDYSKASSFIQEHEMEYMSELAAQAKDKLVAKTGAGNDFLGWIDLPVDYDKEEFARIQKAAEQIRSDSEVLLVIGIGGSYLGARAAIDFLGHSFANVVSKELRKSPEIYYVGNSISSTYLKDLLDVVGDRDFSINMISKSGTTTEPAIAFRVFKEILENKYGKEVSDKLLKTMEVQSENYRGSDMFKASTEFDNSSEYSLNVYTKGAVVFNEIRKEVGDKIFFETLQEYCNNYMFQNVNGNQFMKMWKDKGVDINKIVDKCN